MEHKIKVINQGKPIAIRPYKMPFSSMKLLDSYVHELEEHDLIERCITPHNDPCLLVKKAGKKDVNDTKSWRLVNDFRVLNLATVPIAAEMPDASTILANLGSAKYFSICDISSSFWQVPLAEESQDYTAFSSQGAQWRWKVMAQGLRNSPATFCAVINKVLSRLLWQKGLYAFVDDVLTATPSWNSHMEILQLMFNRFRDQNIKLKLEKAFFGRRNIKYVGHIISAEGIKPDKEKVDAILKMMAPRNVKEMQVFLGMVNYYSKFIRSFTTIARPQQRLVTQEKYVWSKECEIAFNEVKKKLASAELLVFPDYSRPFFIEADGSLEGLGCVLAQEHFGRQTNCICKSSFDSSQKTL